MVQRARSSIGQSVWLRTRRLGVRLPPGVQTLLDSFGERFLLSSPSLYLPLFYLKGGIMGGVSDVQNSVSSGVDFQSAMPAPSFNHPAEVPSFLLPTRRGW